MIKIVFIPSSSELSELFLLILIYIVAEIEENCLVSGISLRALFHRFEYVYISTFMNAYTYFSSKLHLLAIYSVFSSQIITILVLFNALYL